jgi:hypothetical protein
MIDFRVSFLVGFRVFLKIYHCHITRHNGRCPVPHQICGVIPLMALTGILIKISRASYAFSEAGVEYQPAADSALGYLANRGRSPKPLKLIIKTIETGTYLVQELTASKLGG